MWEPWFQELSILQHTKHWNLHLFNVHVVYSLNSILFECLFNRSNLVKVVTDDFGYPSKTREVRGKWHYTCRVIMIGITNEISLVASIIMAVKLIVIRTTPPSWAAAPANAYFPRSIPDRTGNKFPTPIPTNLPHAAPPEMNKCDREFVAQRPLSVCVNLVRLVSIKPYSIRNH